MVILPNPCEIMQMFAPCLGKTMRPVKAHRVCFQCRNRNKDIQLIANL